MMPSLKTKKVGTVVWGLSSILPSTAGLVRLLLSPQGHVLQGALVLWVDSV